MGSEQFQLTTDRLDLVPLTARQLKLWIEDLPALEKELNCQYRADPIEGVFSDIVKKQSSITNMDPDNYLFHSFWFLIRRSDRVVVGSADFKDLPNSQGEVEIGYGLGSDYEHFGYMTEAVQAMSDWGLAQTGIERLLAETCLDGFASQHILLRCGFQKFREMETIWWRRDKSE